MRSFFLKILLWFGLAMVLVIVASFVSGVIIERRSQMPHENHAAPMLGIYAETAAEIFERDGQAALASYLERVEHASHIRAVVLNEQGAEISGRPLLPGASELAKRTNDNEPFVFEPSPPPQQSLAAQRVRGPSGKLYTLVAEMRDMDGHRPPPPKPGSFFFNLHLLGHNLLIMLLVGVLFCLWLARYVTTPVVKLRATAHELAVGNLTARVSDKLVKRHDEIGYLGRDFNIMAERIESLVEAQRRLLRDISHELRSPLARLRVALELVRRRAASDLTSSLDRIEHESENINELIGQLLTLSRVESGAERLRSVPVDLHTLVKDVADDADFEARSRNRLVRVMSCDECTTSGVPELLRSAIENVVRNAVNYTAEGTEVEIALRREEVEAQRFALISVRDHGAGVPEEAIDEIFRPFYRVEDARDRQTGGTGLGLAIAARAMRLHDGLIKAKNAPDGGLIVELRLPVKEYSY